MTTIRKENQITDLSKGKITQVILAFFFPMLLTNMLQQIYTIADTIIVGKGLGDDKLAAVGNMSSLTFLIFGFAMGLSNGFAVIIAQAYGEKNFEKLKKTIAASIKLMCDFAVILTAVSVIFLRELLILMQTDLELIEDGLIYGRIIFGGLAVTLSYNLCSGILRALGDSKTPFYAIIASSIVNIILDVFFIFILHTGVEGAAIATVLSQVVSTFVCFQKLKRIDEIQVSAADFKNCNCYFMTLIANGLPMALMNSITAIGCVVLQYFVNGLGVAYTTAYSATSKYINLFMQPACTAGFTMSAFTSQNYGAKEFDRIRKGLNVCLCIALVSYLVLGTIMMLFPEFLASLMITGKDSIELVKDYLPKTGFMLFTVDFLFVFRNGVQGMGKPLIPMLSGIMEMLLRVVVVLILIDKLGFISTAYSQIAAWIGALIMNLSAFEYHLHKVLGENQNEIKHYNLKGNMHHGSV